MINIGCDIHPFAEARIDDKWFFIFTLSDDRDYDFFARLSGVRSNGQKQWFETILDGDVELSSVVRDEYARWGGDAHSFTVCDYPTLRKMYLDEGETELSNLSVWFEFLSPLANIFGKDNVRVVCWYDN